ncbi:hypothetical protein FQR65_LT09213 [Abscondita terminalis]|nr:hypothetical protein FQR65_LT09213 [Abscondita terminalis]
MKTCLPLRSHLIQYLFAIMCNIIFLSEGMQYGWASSGLPVLLGNNSYTSITKEESKWISNSYIVGDVVGGLFSFVIFNNVSRKLSLYVSCVPVLVSHIGNYFANTATVFYITRFIGGVGRNMNLIIILMYVSEISNPEIRGTLGAFANVFLNTGVIGVTAITTYLSLKISAIVGIVIAIIPFTLIHFLPESPYYLVMVSRKTEAVKSLEILRQTRLVDQEFEDLCIAVKKQTTKNDTLVKKFLLLFTVKTNLKAAGIGMFLKSLQMFSGSSALIMHSHAIFEQAGGSMSPHVSSLIYNGATLFMCLCSTSVVERYPRRTLMITSCFLICLVLVAQGACFYITNFGYDFEFLTWLPVLNLVFFSICYRLGLSTVSIIMCSEIFAVNVKVAGGVLCNIAFSLSSLVANVIFDYTEDAFGMYTPFFIFGGCAAFGGVVSIFFLPETKGKTLDEIQEVIACGKRNSEHNEKL